MHTNVYWKKNTIFVSNPFSYTFSPCSNKSNPNKVRQTHATNQTQTTNKC